MRYALVLLVTIGAGLGAEAKAEDLCSALQRLHYEVGVAAGAIEEADRSVSSLRLGLRRAPELFSEEYDALAEPADGVRDASRQLGAAIEAISELRSSRCPDVPNPYAQ